MMNLIDITKKAKLDIHTIAILMAAQVHRVNTQ